MNIRTGFMGFLLLLSAASGYADETITPAGDNDQKKFDQALDSDPNLQLRMELAAKLIKSGKIQNNEQLQNFLKAGAPSPAVEQPASDSDHAHQ